MIYAGKLTEKLSFYDIIETQSASGFKSTQEQFLFTCLAERMKNKENYVVDAGELYHTNELTFRMRSRKEVKETSIVVYNEERYRITSLNKFPRDNEMTLIIARINE